MEDPTLSSDRARSRGCADELGRIAAGYVLPSVSLNFYRAASRRRVISAALFFLVFTVTVSILVTIKLGRDLASARADIRQAFESGDFPEISIENGIASVSGPQPFVFFEEGNAVAIIDTTGATRQLDRSRYAQGFLLTQTSLHMLSDGEYQRLALRDLNEMLNANPIVINAESASRFWGIISTIFVVVFFAVLVLWNTLFRFMILTFLAVIVWGIASWTKGSARFGAVLGVGIFALVPAVYGSYLLGRAGIEFFGLQTILLLIVWGVALSAALSESTFENSSAEVPQYVRQTLYGLPMLSIFAVVFVFSDSWVGTLLVWLAAVVTVLAIRRDISYSVRATSPSFTPDAPDSENHFDPPSR